MHEILTIQLGSQANYVGTHFWNAQESYFTYEGQEESPVDHGVHFREGIGADGSDTFTPRTVVYDFKNDFGSLRRTNELYEQLQEDETSPNRLWDGSIVAQNQPQINMNSYQRSLNQGLQPSALSKADVRFWSDFNRVFYHPKSIVQIYEAELNPGQRAFDDWSTGEELFASLDREEDLIDRDIRSFVEECDQIQGLQIFTGSETAWAGFGARYLDHLRDEFGKLPIWVYGVGEPEDANVRRAHRTVNQAKSLCEFSDQASMYIPVLGAPTALPAYVSLDKKHSWHASAIQAAGFESALIPTRLKSSSSGESASLDHLAIALAGDDNHRIAQLSFEIGNHLSSDQFTNGNNSNSATQPNALSVPTACDLFSVDPPSTESVEGHFFSRMTTDRGDWPKDEETQSGSPEYSFREFRSMKFTTPLCMPLPDSFPKIFSIRDKSNFSAAVRARLDITPKIGKWAKSYEQTVRTRVGYQEREELLNTLRSIGDAYATGIDSDDDDYDSDEF